MRCSKTLGPEARLLAGGHSLLPMMKLRLAKPEYVIDIDPLADELGYVDERDGEIRIGAMTRHAALLDSPLLERRLAIFTDAERVIADPVVRNRGTIGGALCQADPSEDLSAVCAAVDARLVIRARDGRARRRHARVPPRPVRDRGRPGRDADRDPRPAARALRQRVPEGRPPRRRLGGRRRRRLARLRPRRHDRPRGPRRSPPSAETSRAAAAEQRSIGHKPSRRALRPGREARRSPRANRSPINADPRTTKDTSSAS